jgi:feruloyl esterase
LNFLPEPQGQGALRGVAAQLAGVAAPACDCCCGGAACAGAATGRVAVEVHPRPGVMDPVAESTLAELRAEGLAVEAVRTALAGPKDSHGNAVYPAYPYDTGIDANGPGAIPGFLMSAPGPVGGADVATTMDVDAQARAVATPIAAVGDTADWTNLSSFAGNGGKLIFYHGMSDPWFSANDTTQYYERVVADNGGSDAVHGWSRLFLVPGMGHCQGGSAALDRFDLLSAIVAWTEEGKAPESVIATGRAFPARGRPLCPYPRHAHYVGQGDSESASSYECRE